MSSAFQCDGCKQFFKGDAKLYDGYMYMRKYKWLPSATFWPNKRVEFTKELCPECSKKVMEFMGVVDQAKGE